MRLHVLSDLHLEGAPFEPPEVDADIAILAGDISTGTRGVDWARRLSWAGGGRPVLYVAGNHEFYGEAFPALIGDLRAASTGSAVHVLENDEVVLDGVRFLGCTLWSDFLFDGPEHRQASMALCARLVNDYRQIRGQAGNGPLTPATTLEHHVASRAWLTDRLAAPFDGPTVVITHHAPLIRRRPKRQVLRLVAGAFATDLSELMGGDKAQLWIYGHTHQPADLDVAGTRVLSNPRGYVRESIAAFDPGATVELRTR
jgi:predicted phosphodiesterase